MSPFVVVKSNVLLRMFNSSQMVNKDNSIEAFRFKATEEPLHNGIIPAVTASAHALSNAMQF